MFDQSLEYKLVQIRKNRFIENESYLQEYIYSFYRHNSKCCIKYIVSVKTYEHGLMTLDYYPKLNLTPRFNSLYDIQDLRYRMLTKQNSFGVIGGTILDIMLEINSKTGNNVWGFLAANLPGETTNANNKRYQVYTEVLRRTFIHHFDVFGNKENSAIFMIPKAKASNLVNIIEQYEQIFSETN
ncbi:hypothetical protein ADIARSV_0035 [Arcticibacter svalbardensis MN12-7]|uniref:Uncharacterized protein n=1 Tax=Arcticibacter svalbardensis MN12-7 TaxID=1150600 RepID=R9GY87_9SPHI|nr:hypothetical protein [Arcticibacter svalbardensis]EOR96772.1 hypothetical protein ADIARSV_0035 [Arcticibacter svalbardensis MN12-7]